MIKAKHKIIETGFHLFIRPNLNFQKFLNAHSFPTHCRTVKYLVNMLI